MKRLLFGCPLFFIAAGPAYATAGMVCSTGGANPVDVALVISRVVAGPLVSATLIDSGAEVPVSMAQWWQDEREIRLILIDPNAEREELLLKGKRRGDDYVGTVTRRGRSRAVRCEESG